MRIICYPNVKSIVILENNNVDKQVEQSESQKKDEQY